MNKLLLLDCNRFVLPKKTSKTCKNVRENRSLPSDNHQICQTTTSVSNIGSVKSRPYHHQNIEVKFSFVKILQDNKEFRGFFDVSSCSVEIKKNCSITNVVDNVCVVFNSIRSNSL